MATNGARICACLSPDGALGLPEGMCVHVHRLTADGHQVALQCLCPALCVAYGPKRLILKDAADAGTPVQDVLESQYFPTKRSVRAGDFGEILASELAVDEEDLTLLVRPWQLRDSRDLPARGTDVIAFRLEDEGTDILLAGEVKTVSTRRNARALEQAYLGVKTDAAYRLAATLRKYRRILASAGGRRRVAETVDRFANPSKHGAFELRLRAYVVHDAGRWDAIATAALPAETPPTNLRIQVLLVDDLPLLITTCYDHAGEHIGAAAHR